MTIRQATTVDIPTIQAMADVVFRSTYARILSTHQMDYMMNWMYSAESLEDQINTLGKEFFIAIDEDMRPAGYVSIEKEGHTPDHRPLVHLQKIYVMPSVQKSGLGSKLFKFVCERLSAKYPHGCRIELNVNRNNTAVNFYEKMGMRRDREGDFDIGQGYYMNDYIYAIDI